MSILSKLTTTTTKAMKRRGQGYGSGKGGHTSGRGQKGQKSRQGANIPLWFEGGQLPLIKRLPMWRGKGQLKPLNHTVEVTLADLESLSLTDVTLDSLKLARVIDKRAKNAKIIATGSLSRAVTITGLRTSAKAKSAIEAAGGSVAE